ncbi:MAG: hypothetical protein H6866_03890 [Rhodospirillales bacterium]|nr:MAG: hypothetical protein H6866_03890 [Rhodospirillales bacterium]
MWFFGKDKDKSKKGKTPGDAGKVPSVPGAPMTSKQEKTQALMAQMRSLRAEIGEENLQELVKKLKLEDLKKQVRHDIDHDPRKRDRLIDEIRLSVREDD